MTRFRVPKLGWHLLLALCMLLMQQGALRHSLQHVQEEDTAPAHSLCKDCLAFHAAEQAVSSAALPKLPTLDLPHAVVLLPASEYTTEANLGYLSRAPPLQAV